MSASSRKVNAGLSILLAAVLFICVTIITNYFLGFARIDLTENRLFTLSQGTLNTLRDIDETITLRFFFSRELANEFPQIRLYGERVRELLRAQILRSSTPNPSPKKKIKL